MTVHKSLQGGSKLMKHRNVLTRVERLLKLQKEGRWNPETDSPLGIPKVRNIMQTTAKKSKKKDKEEEEAAAPDAQA